ncbi:MAG: bestrophin family ion channel, partial [Myxococcota bacterium]|nr:bestrophin family ion channel [Myxococcota bacterium]
MILNDPSKPYRASFYTLFFKWQRPTALWCIGTSAIIAALDFYELLGALKLPSFPLAVIGGALGIFVSFRTNSAYQRWWEGRKLWGRMINTSRHITSQAITYLPEEQATLTVHRHAAYVHALRCGLRDEDPHQDPHFCRNLDEESRVTFQGATNLNHALLLAQLKDFVQLLREKKISDFFLSDLDESLRHLLDIQGGCERIKKTPFPPLYGHLAARLTQLYAVLFPLCLVKDIGWFVIPAN